MSCSAFIKGLDACLTLCCVVQGAPEEVHVLLLPSQKQVRGSL